MTQSQTFLKWAIDRVGEQPIDKKYRTAVLKTPALIQTCGLAQATAFIYGKSKSDPAGYGRLLSDLNSLPDAKGNISTRSFESNTVDYMRLTRQTMTALGFLKRMVIAYAPEEIK